MSELKRRHINEVMDMFCLTRGDMNWSQVYYADDADKVIAEKDAEIAEIKQRYNDMDIAHTVHIAKMNARIEELESKNAQLEDDVAFWKKKLSSCLNGDCILTCDTVEKYGKENVRLKRALWLERAERYKMREFIAREEGNLSNQMSWSRILRERTYNQWVDQLLRIANLANKLQSKCRAKAEEYK